MKPMVSRVNGCLLIGLGAVLLAACGERGPEKKRFALDSSDVEVVFHGEVGNDELFGGKSLLDQVRPSDAAGEPAGLVYEAQPDWLKFDYRVDSVARSVLVAKRPLLNDVTWNAIARAGAAFGKGNRVELEGRVFEQALVIEDREGLKYRVRLPTCGTATMANLSEWNLLIGGVHEGDMDFRFDHHGWIASPYTDSDLKVGYKGSLNWCQDLKDSLRVVRGYFSVSRFHASQPETATTRLFWRPVLEQVDASPTMSRAEPVPTGQQSPDGRTVFVDRIESAEVFGPNAGILDQVPIVGGLFIHSARPDWLHFRRDGRTLLVAAWPILHSVTWNAIARAGAVRGDGGLLRAGWWFYRQNATVEDIDGREYRVRLVRCGDHTLDHDSEWNALIGGVHVGDGDFHRYPEGLYGWIEEPLNDLALVIGTRPGGSTWCMERKRVGIKLHAINRGFLTVSRHHATVPDFVGWGFGWRPVLELIQDSTVTDLP